MNTRHDDWFNQVCAALGLFDGARPVSPQRVLWDEVLPTIAALKANNPEALAKMADANRRADGFLSRYHECETERQSLLQTVKSLVLAAQAEERERLRIAAYRQARIFEPSAEAYHAAMSVYAAAFGKPDGEVEAMLPSGEHRQPWELLAALEPMQELYHATTVRAVAAEHQKSLSLLGRSSYAEVVEDKLRTKLAEAEIRAEQAESRVKELEHALTQSAQELRRLEREVERLRREGAR